MKPIAIFYHGLLFMGDPPALLENAVKIIKDQMDHLRFFGLLHTAEQFHVGLNGSVETAEIAYCLFPVKAQITLHGLQCRNELRTIFMLVQWAKEHPGWYVFYFHSKGASHPKGHPYGDGMAAPWRHAMMTDLADKWRDCVAALDGGADIVTSHWMWNMADGTQHIPAGNFLWIKSDFVAKLPSMMNRDRIKQSGLDALESRYEAEVFWGNGPRPIVHQFRPNGGGGVP